MTDPRRYYIDAHEDVVIFTASKNGDWIKYTDFLDYKAGQRRNKTLELNTKLGVEVAEMRSKLADLKAEVERLQAKEVQS